MDIAVKPQQPNIIESAQIIAATIAKRAAEHDENDSFVAENYALLKEHRLIEAGVPKEFGGSGAEVPELCEMLRLLSQACGSTGLAFSMHTHQVAFPAWRWKHKGVTVVEPLLKRIAAEQLIMLSSGGSDWLGGSGKAEKVKDGYRINARKVFSSGSELGDLMMSSALFKEDDGGQSVIHFGIPMNADGVAVQDNWRTLGMRGTGSNDVVIKDLFIPDAGVAFSRAAGEWHPVFEILAPVAFTLVYAVYLGIAESARDIAINLAKKRPISSDMLNIAGRMDTTLRAAKLAHRLMVETVENLDPSPEAVNDVMIGRTLVGDNTIRTVELAMELAGGAGFYRSAGLERRFRDIQAARYHPLQAGPQAAFAGALALGQPTANIF